MIEYTVQDMTCGSCARRITQAVEKLDPEAQVDVDVKARRVRIESRHSAEALRAKIQEAGYTPEAVAS